MRVERTHSERFEARISSRVILDQEIKEANSSSQSSLLSPLRPWLDGDRLATFLNQLNLYADAIKSGESGPPPSPRVASRGRDPAIPTLASRRSTHGCGRLLAASPATTVCVPEHSWHRPSR